jgi:hypothetical protein
MSIFYAATTITLGNGCKTPFWHAPWLGGRIPRDIALKKFECSKRKNWSMHGDAWILKVNLDNNFTIEHLTQFKSHVRPRWQPKPHRAQHPHPHAAPTRSCITRFEGGDTPSVASRFQNQHTSAPSIPRHAPQPAASDPLPSFIPWSRSTFPSTNSPWVIIKY